MNQPSAVPGCRPREIKNARSSARTTGLADRKKPSHNPSSSPIRTSRGTSVTAPTSGSDTSCDGSSGLGIITHLRARC
jgi:hypothetical protein